MVSDVFYTQEKAKCLKSSSCFTHQFPGNRTPVIPVLPFPTDAGGPFSYPLPEGAPEDRTSPAGGAGHGLSQKIRTIRLSVSDAPFSEHDFRASRSPAGAGIRARLLFREPALPDGEAATAWPGEHSDTDNSPAVMQVSLRWIIS